MELEWLSSYSILSGELDCIHWTSLSAISCEYSFSFTFSERTLIAFVGICLVIISEWPPLSDRLLWFWSIKSQEALLLIISSNEPLFFFSLTWILHCIFLSLIICLCLSPFHSLQFHFFEKMLFFRRHSQFIYWLVVYCSANNLVLIALERYLAVMDPMKYKTLNKRWVAIALSVLYGYTLCWRWPNCFYAM